MQKKGQIALFIIAGVVLIIITLLVYFSESEYSSPSFGSNLDTKPVSDYVQACLEKTTAEGIMYLSLNGFSPKSTSGLFPTTYLISGGSASLPLKSDVEAALSDFTQKALTACIEDFSPLDNKGFSISAAAPTIDTSIGDSITTHVRYPLEIRSGDEKVSIDSFSSTTHFDFRRVYSILSVFMAEHQKNPNYVPIGHLSYLAMQANFTYELYYLNNSDVIYSFIFNDLFEDNRTVIVNFGAHYDW